MEDLQQKVQRMTTSPWLYDFLKQWEKFRPTAYLPTPKDVWTIGYGSTDGVREGDTCTREEAFARLDKDVQWAVDAVNRLVREKLKQHQFDALVSLVFNIGSTAFKNSTLLEKLNAGNYGGAQEQFHVWKKQAGKTLAGLVKRRAAEAEHFGSTASPPKP